MPEMNEETAFMSEDSSTDEKITESSDYPSACFLLDSCIQDYQRLQENSIFTEIRLHTDWKR